MEPLIKDPESKEEPQAPNYEVIAAEEKVRRESIEARLKEKSEEYDRRMAAFDQQSQAPQQVQAPPPPQEPDFGPEMTEEEVAANPKAAYDQLKEQLVTQQQQYSEAISRAGFVMNNLAQETHETQLRSLKDRDFMDRAEPLIRAYYEQNPKEKVPGMGRSPEEVYSIIVGNNWKGWEKERIAADPGPDPNLAPQRPANPERVPQAYETPITTPTIPSSAPADKKEKEVHLSELEDDIRKEFNTRSHTNISRAEWRAISDGKVLPKQATGAADWQRSGPPQGSRSTSEE